MQERRDGVEGGREQGRGGGETLALMEVGLVAAQGLLAGDDRPFEVRQDQKSRITKQRLHPSTAPLFSSVQERAFTFRVGMLILTDNR